MAKLYFRYGAMGSSKTANAIMVQYNYHERGQNALMLKPKMDDRDGSRIVASRSGLSAQCAFVEELDEIDLSGYDCVIVDESQFLTKAQVQKLVDIADERDIPVICYGLRADFQGNLFEGSTWLMAWADTIEEIKTVCWCGRKATFNTRIADGKVVRTGEQILIGGNESYVALCRRHWATGELAPIEVRALKDGRRAYLPLLLEADPSVAQIERYLEKGEMFLLLAHGQAVAEAVVLQRENGVCELCSLAVAPDRRGQGYGTRLVRHLLKVYRPRCRRMEVGTSPGVAGFYERLGFRFSHLRENYFQKNYPEPIFENGAALTDMHVLSLDF